MNHKAQRARTILSKGAVLLALLFATSVHAASRDATDFGTISFGQPGGTGERSRFVQGLGSNDAFERRSFSSKKPAAVRTGHSRKVYLEDYQRVPKAVGRRHQTQPHVLGQGNRRR